MKLKTVLEPYYKYIAFDGGGTVFAYENKPRMGSSPLCEFEWLPPGTDVNKTDKFMSIGNIVDKELHPREIEFATINWNRWYYKRYGSNCWEIELMPGHDEHEQDSCRKPDRSNDKSQCPSTEKLLQLVCRQAFNEILEGPTSECYFEDLINFYKVLSIQYRWEQKKNKIVWTGVEPSELELFEIWKRNTI